MEKNVIHWHCSIPEYKMFWLQNEGKKPHTYDIKSEHYEHKQQIHWSKNDLQQHDIYSIKKLTGAIYL